MDGTEHWMSHWMCGEEQKWTGRKGVYAFVMRWFSSADCIVYSQNADDDDDYSHSENSLIWSPAIP